MKRLIVEVGFEFCKGITISSIAWFSFIIYTWNSIPVNLLYWFLEIDHGDEFGDDPNNFEMMYGKASEDKSEEEKDEKYQPEVSARVTPRAVMFEQVTELI